MTAQDYLLVGPGLLLWGKAFEMVVVVAHCVQNQSSEGMVRYLCVLGERMEHWVHTPDLMDRSDKGSSEEVDLGFQHILERDYKAVDSVKLVVATLMCLEEPHSPFEPLQIFHSERKSHLQKQSVILPSVLLIDTYLFSVGIC